VVKYFKCGQREDKTKQNKKSFGFKKKKIKEKKIRRVFGPPNQ
jgi:hypothetical protein